MPILKGTRTLPENYRVVGTLNLIEDKRTLVIMNILGFVLFILFGWLFPQILFWMRPLEAAKGLSGSLSNILDVLKAVAMLLGIIVLMLLLHEGFHGIFFAFFNHKIPAFGFRGYYAYASAPGWYFPKFQYLVIALAPFVLITGLGFLGLAFVPPGWFIPILTLMVLNASGAVGDLMVAGWLLRQPASCLAQDEGDSVTLFAPQ